MSIVEKFLNAFKERANDDSLSCDEANVYAKLYAELKREGTICGIKIENEWYIE